MELINIDKQFNTSDIGTKEKMKKKNKILWHNDNHNNNRSCGEQKRKK